MATLRSQILDAIQTALDGPSKPSGLRVYRFRLASIEPDFLPSVVMRPVHEDTADRNSNNTRGALVERLLTVRLEFRAAAATVNDSADVALEALLAWGTKALQAGSRTLGGLVIEASEVSTDWDADEGAADYGMASVDYLFRYTTKTTDQEARQ